MDVERFGIPEVIGSPDLVQHEMARHQPALAREKQMQERKLFRWQRHEIAPHPHFVTLGVEDDGTGRQHLVAGNGAGHAGPAQLRPHA